MEDEMGGQVAWPGEMRNSCKLMVRKPEGTRPIGRQA
jgi:hypothetical protein